MTKKTVMELIQEEAADFGCSKVKSATYIKKLGEKAKSVIYMMGDDTTTFEGFAYTPQYAAAVSAVHFALSELSRLNDESTSNRAWLDGKSRDEIVDKIVMVATDYKDAVRSFVSRQRKAYEKAPAEEKEAVMKLYTEVNRSTKTTKKAPAKKTNKKK